MRAWSAVLRIVVSLCPKWTEEEKGGKKGVDDTHGVNNSKSTTLLFFLCCSSSVVRLLLLLLFSLFFVREMTVCVFFSPAFVSLLVFSLSVFFFSR